MARQVGITRQQYKDLKRKDHRQMNAFLIKFWQDGYGEGMAAAKKANIPPAAIEKAIRGVRGIGDVKANAIMREVYKLYGEAREG